MTPKQVQTLARLLAVVALLLLIYHKAKAELPQDYITRLLNPVPALGSLPMLPIYPAKKPVVAAPVKKPTVPPNRPVVKPSTSKVLTQAQQDANGLKTAAWLTAHLWWRESEGYNRGPGINEAIRENGGVQGEEYCGDTQAKAQRTCGLYVPPASNGSYNWFLPRLGRNVKYGTTGTFDSARIGYKVGIFNRSKNRIAHITATVEKPITKVNGNAPAKGSWNIAGNEGRGTNAGVHKTWYPAINQYAIANYNR